MFFCPAEGELFETALQMRKAGDVVELIQGQVEAPQLLEISEKAQVLTCLAIHVQLDIGPVGDELRGPLQLRGRQRPIKLDDLATRLQRSERISETVGIVSQETAVRACRRRGGTIGHATARVVDQPPDRLVWLLSAADTQERVSGGAKLQNSRCQCLGTRHHRVDATPLVVAVGVAADGAGAAQGRGPERRGEAAVGRAPGCLGGDLETEIRGGAAVGLKELTALFVLLERQEVAFAQDAALAAGQFAAAAN